MSVYVPNRSSCSSPLLGRRLGVSRRWRSHSHSDRDRGGDGDSALRPRPKGLSRTVAPDFARKTDTGIDMSKDAGSAGFYESPNKKKYPRVQLLTIEGLLAKTHRAEHPDYEPDLNFKKAKQEEHGRQKELI